MRYELSDYEWTAIKPMLPNDSAKITKMATIAGKCIPSVNC